MTQKLKTSMRPFIRDRALKNVGDNVDNRRALESATENIKTS
jgi:hypothetical protein